VRDVDRIRIREGLIYSWLVMGYEECRTERETRACTKQTFAEVSFEQYRKPTRIKRFLDEMNRIIPWEDLVAAIVQVYPKAEGPRRPPPAVDCKVCLHCLHQ
jgi:hypothetical protein